VNLLADYFRRDGFWSAVRDRGVPVEWAGNELMGTKKRRSYEIYEELERTYGPLKWFRTQALDGMTKGSIGRGRATKRSNLADAFFVGLAGGAAGINSLKTEFEGMDTLEFRELETKNDPVRMEILRYLVHSHNLWSDCDE
jgi:hypothetical protein